MRQPLEGMMARAEHAYQADRLTEAEQLLASLRRDHPGGARVWHLSALVAERLGRAEDALAAFARATRCAPEDMALLVDHAVRLGERSPDVALRMFDRALARAPRLAIGYLERGRLLHRLRRWPESRADLLRVYQLEPKWLAGWLARGALEIDAGMPDAAAIAYDHAIALAPGHRDARHARARIGLDRGDNDLATRLAELATDFPCDRAIAIAEAEALELQARPDAHARLSALVAADPAWAEGQAVLARMRWEAGADDFDAPLREALATYPSTAPLHDALLALLNGTDRFSEAADVAATAATATGEARFRLLEAMFAGLTGDIARTERLFAALPVDLPGRSVHEARHRIRTGAFDAAERLLEAATARDMGDVMAWALRGIAWRAAGDPRAAWLHGQPGLVHAHRLPLDEGEIAATADVLRALHVTSRHPVGQSMRRGTQTRGKLLARSDPVIGALRRAIGEAVMAHWRTLPPRDDHHPLLRHRDLQPTLAGSWSVRLTDGGHHVPHIHPRGDLSSASYWVTPSDRAGGAARLELGRPPGDLALALPPLATFAPEPGTLVLFPSTLFHGTTPFTEGERISVAFDIAAR